MAEENGGEDYPWEDPGLHRVWEVVLARLANNVGHFGLASLPSPTIALSMKE